LEKERTSPFSGKHRLLLGHLHPQFINSIEKYETEDDSLLAPNVDRRKERHDPMADNPNNIFTNEQKNHSKIFASSQSQKNASIFKDGIDQVPRKIETVESKGHTFEELKSNNGILKSAMETVQDIADSNKGINLKNELSQFEDESDPTLHNDNLKYDIIAKFNKENLDQVMPPKFSATGKNKSLNKPENSTHNKSNDKSRKDIQYRTVKRNYLDNEQLNISEVGPPTGNKNIPHNQSSSNDSKAFGENVQLQANLTGRYHLERRGQEIPFRSGSHKEINPKAIMPKQKDIDYETAKVYNLDSDLKVTKPARDHEFPLSREKEVYYAILDKHPGKSKDEILSMNSPQFISDNEGKNMQNARHQEQDIGNILDKLMDNKDLNKEIVGMHQDATGIPLNIEQVAISLNHTKSPEDIRNKDSMNAIHEKNVKHQANEDRNIAFTKIVDAGQKSNINPIEFLVEKGKQIKFEIIDSSTSPPNGETEIENEVLDSTESSDLDHQIPLTIGDKPHLKAKENITSFINKEYDSEDQSKIEKADIDQVYNNELHSDIEGNTSEPNKTQSSEFKTSKQDDENIREEDVLKKVINENKVEELKEENFSTSGKEIMYEKIGTFPNSDIIVDNLTHPTGSVEIQNSSKENSESMNKEHDSYLQKKNNQRKKMHYQIFKKLSVKNENDEILHQRMELVSDTEKLLYNSMERDGRKGEEVIKIARPIGEMLALKANVLRSGVKAVDDPSFQKIAGEGSELHI
jgi:hypothetical protein